MKEVSNMTTMKEIRDFYPDTMCSWCKHHPDPDLFAMQMPINCKHPKYDCYDESIKLDFPEESGEFVVTFCPYYERDVSDKTNYYQYLDSERWKKKATKRMSMDNYKCVKCGSAKNLAVHHITYDRLFCEPMDDLITVCNNCHKKIHENDLE